MTLGPKHTIAFDLDGTLVDTAPDLCRALNFALDQRGLPPVAEELVRADVGLGARKMIEDGIKRAGKRDDHTLMQELERDFLSFYAANIAVASRPCPGVVNALERYRDWGVHLGICTNKREALSRQLLDELGLLSFFKCVVGADTLAVRKPDPGHLLETIRRAGGHSDRAVMVGDSAIDVATAKAAGVPIVVVSFGYTDVPAQQLGGDRLIDHLDDLDHVLADLI
ncbi:MAG: phosphoglycolate phosphatase [Alphaproteobacteria bacterium]|nr:MAG: phosphoglycolate phosphatase [Alphaproteobacteria bacterium]